MSRMCPEYRSVLEMKRNLEQNSKNQDQFFNQVNSSKDGFSVIAEYFGKGIISKTSKGPSGSPDSTTTVSEFLFDIFFYKPEELPKRSIISGGDTLLYAFIITFFKFVVLLLQILKSCVCEI
ncbi:putative vacuolar protein sorting-associated protein [Helianthus annuus]|nr:putative vacuolar protein sorting-associated protein [Helianthus annuus]KAJ0887917.1 putative vacuolar protein sorting-associated protein [Helianthus annuus]